MPDIVDAENFVFDPGIGKRDIEGFKLTIVATGLNRRAVGARMKTRMATKYPLKVDQIEVLSSELIDEDDGQRVEKTTADILKSQDEAKVEEMRQKRQQRKQERSGVAGPAGVSRPTGGDRGPDVANKYRVEIFIPYDSIVDRAKEVIEELFERAQN